ncbi:MAG TPA: ABC transporter substrate-binding protein [Anaerolineae bacterium]|nr:ABC transporter substrate-binding protein [Anaerolineae bacterium]
MMKRLMYLVLVVTLLLGLAMEAGCRPVPTPTPTPLPPTPAPPTPTPAVAVRPLVLVEGTEAITLDPHYNDFGYSQRPQRAAYESLVNYEETPEGEVKLVPMLAKSWEISPDAKVVTLHLQEGVKFSDGTPFNAEAVKYNFERIFALNMQPAGRLPKFESMEVIDEHTLRITLEKPFAPIMDALAKPLMVSPTAAREHEVEGDWGHKWLDDHMVGTGPYLLKEWVRGQYISFVKNPNYWRGWEGNHLEGIVIKYVKEAATRRMMLETGDADIALGISFEDLDPLSKAPGVVVEQRNAANLYMLKLRFRGPLADKRVRQALQYAFDYKAFIEGVLNGRARYPRGPLPSTVWAFDETLPEFKQDLDKAKALLAEAGYPEGGFSLVVQIIPPFGWFQPMEAAILKENLAKLGIEVTIDEKADAPTYIGALKELETGPDIYAWTFANSLNDPEDNFRREYYTGLQFGKGGTNGIFYSNPRVDELIDKGVSIASREERRPIYEEIQRILREDAPAIFVAEPYYYLCRREGVQDLRWHPFAGNNGHDWWYVWLSE